MSTNKFLTFLNGATTLITAISTSSGVTDGNKIPMTSSDGTLHTSLFPTGIGADTQIVVASESLAAGDFVNIFDNNGTRNVRKADAANNRPALGFVLTPVNSADNATVYTAGVNNALTGLTPGTRYFLSSTSAGKPTSTSPIESNQISQSLGFAISPNAVALNADNIIFIA